MENNLEINDILDDSFKTYANYVNFHRSIPHYVDGLKNVQRRILYTMYLNKWFSNKAYVKVSRIIGQTMGTLHPHGDSSIAGALVRMAQPYHSASPLIDGEGNYGDGLEMGAAAPRYIEAKLSSHTEKFFNAINKDIVGWTENYDNTMYEPDYLPAPYPQLLVSPILGIGVGKMTSIPSHNIEEVIKATQFAMQTESFDEEDLLKILKGPDFPSGCDIVNKKDFLDIYKNGRGSFRMRSKFTWEGNTLIVSNFPYGVSASKVEQEIADQHMEFDFCEIINTTAKTQELRLVFNRQKDEYIRNLCWKTSLEETFSFQFRAIEGNEAKIFSLKEFFVKWKENYLQRIRKEFQFDLQKLGYKREQLNGLLKALSIIDKVVAWIKNSSTKKEAKEILIENGFSEIQADFILDMRLSKLVSTEIASIQKEIGEIDVEVSRLNNLLSNKKDLITECVDRISQSYTKTKRVSEIKDEEYSKPKKVKSTTFYARQKGEVVLVSESSTKGSVAGDKNNPVFVATKNNQIAPIKSPEDSIGKGLILDGVSSLIHVSKEGLVKKTDPSNYKVARKSKASGQKDTVAIFNGDGWLLFTGREGEQVQFSTEEIKATGRTAKGVIGIKGDFKKVELIKDKKEGVLEKRRHTL